MRYLVRERIFSFSDSFTIDDENGRPCYEIVGKVFSIGNKLNLYDMQGRALIYIEQKVFRFLPEYTIYEDNSVVAKVQKELTFFKPKFTINSSYGHFTIEGDIFAYNFNIMKNGKSVAWVSKKFMSFSDTYSVDIVDEENQAFILGLVIVLDQIHHDNRNNS